MEYRQLGKTFLRVSIAGFGASPLGDVFGRIDPSESTAAVHFALDNGINFFDVSPYYGLTLAESRLGEALEGHRGRAVLATKCGRYGAEEFDFSAQRITEGVEQSLKRLRTDHLDLLQAHDVEFGDAQQIIHETLPAMRRLQAAGKTRYIGITGYSLKALTAIASQVPVDTLLSYCRYNLMITDMEDKLTPFATEHHIGLINASPLHMGILTESDAPSWHPAPEEVRAAGRRVVAVCKKHGVDLAQVAQRFCFDNPHVSSTLTGMSTRAHVEATLHSLATPNDPQLLAEIARAIGPELNTVWPSGRVENRD